MLIDVEQFFFKEKERLKIMMEAEIEKMKKKACIEEEKRLVREK